MTMGLTQAKRILGVDGTFDKEILKKNYRQLAMDLHTDRHPDDKEKEAQFREATEAYVLLRDGLQQGLDPEDETTWDTVRDIYQEGRMQYGSEEWGTGAQTAADIYHVIFSGQNPEIDFMMEDIIASVIEELRAEDVHTEDD